MPVERSSQPGAVFSLPRPRTSEDDAPPPTGGGIVPVYTVATVPAANSVDPDTVIQVLDAPEGMQLAISDGTFWRYVEPGERNFFGEDPAIYFDDFSTDTIANYTPNTNLSVTGGKMVPTATGSKQPRVTDAGALAGSMVISACMRFGGGRHYSGVMKYVDANNYIIGIHDSDLGGIKIFQTVAGSTSELVASGGGVGVDTDHWLVLTIAGPLSGTPNQCKLHRYAANPEDGGAPSKTISTAINAAIGANGLPGLSWNNLDNNACSADNLKAWVLGQQPFTLP